MLVSVVMPVYNCAPYIHQAVESVINQTHQNLEILVCDDCSTDETKEILRKFDDPRIKIFESDINKGQAHQLNKGTSLARGEYIAIMHGDDICHPDRIKEQLSFLETNRYIDICGCWIDFEGDWKKYNYPGGVYKYLADDELIKLNLLEGVPFAHPAVFLRKSLVASGQFIYKQEFVPAEDWELWVRIAPKVKFGNVEKPLVTYRIHNSQISVTAAERFDNCRKQIRQEYFRLLYQFSEKESVTLEDVLYNRQGVIDRRHLTLLFSFLKKSVLPGANKNASYGLQKTFLHQELMGKIQSGSWLYTWIFLKNSNVMKALGMRSVGGLLKRKLFSGQ